MPFPSLSVVEVGVGHVSILQSGGRHADSVTLPSRVRPVSCLSHGLPPTRLLPLLPQEEGGKDGWMDVGRSLFLLPFVSAALPCGGWPGIGFPSVFSASETALTTVNQRC